MGFCFHRPLFFSALYFFHLFFPRNLRPRGPSSFQVLTWGDEQERSRGASTQVVIKSCQADNDGASNGTMLRSSPDIGHSSCYSRERKRASLSEKTLTSAVAVTFAGSEETFDFLFIIQFCWWRKLIWEMLFRWPLKIAGISRMKRSFKINVFPPRCFIATNQCCVPLAAVFVFELGAAVPKR